jgi:hypothetical protein
LVRNLHKTPKENLIWGAAPPGRKQADSASLVTISKRCGKLIFGVRNVTLALQESR